MSSPDRLRPIPEIAYGIVALSVVALGLESCQQPNNPNTIPQTPTPKPLIHETLPDPNNPANDARITVYPNQVTVRKGFTRTDCDINGCSKHRSLNVITNTQAGFTWIAPEEAQQRAQEMPSDK